jgi:hypothetical protein
VDLQALTADSIRPPRIFFTRRDRDRSSPMVRILHKYDEENSRQFRQIYGITIYYRILAITVRVYDPHQASRPIW